MEILSLSFGEEVRQALSYADVTLRAWNKKKGLWVDSKKKNTNTTNKKNVYQNEWGWSF